MVANLGFPISNSEISASNSLVTGTHMEGCLYICSFLYFQAAERSLSTALSQLDSIPVQT